jgi:hypothetical protein
MDKAKLDIENRLVPKGENVKRHLALPSEGKTLEWIIQEMDTMDTELGGSGDTWKAGKLSGAVYRTHCVLYREINKTAYILHRWRGRAHQNNCCRVFTLLRI